MNQNVSLLLSSLLVFFELCPIYQASSSAEESRTPVRFLITELVSHMQKPPTLNTEGIIESSTPKTTELCELPK